MDTFTTATSLSKNNKGPFKTAVGPTNDTDAITSHRRHRATS